MTRGLVPVILLSVVGATSCNSWCASPRSDAGLPDAGTPSVRWDRPDPGPPGAPLWGVADLHAHPAIHLAFGGSAGHPGLFWGDAGSVASWPGDLADVIACDPETHSADLHDQVTRASRALVISLLTRTTQYPHTPGGAPDYVNWPNGRDLFHNGMQIQSIRRAYEGGLRLMFASATESQTLGEILGGTVFPGVSHTSIAREKILAEVQLIYIREMVNANSDWMQLVTTPDQAEAAIRDNRLAIVLALEMDALALEDIEDLVRRYSVATVVPVHLIDNAVGGTAANNDIFNANTALMGRLFGNPGRYISVDGDPLLKFRFDYPKTLSVDSVSYGVGSLAPALEAALHYTNHPLCDPPSLGIPGELGHRNTIGLRDTSAIRKLMRMGVMVDIAHMGFRSTEDAIEVAKNFCNYPLIDSHTGVRSSTQPGFSERELFTDHARWLTDNGGMIGFGTEGRVARTRCSDGLSPAPVVGSARGGPLLKLNGGSRAERGVVLFPAARACNSALPAGLTDLRLALVQTGDLTPDKRDLIAFAEVTHANGHKEQVSLDGGFAQLGGSTSDITSIDVGLLDRARCQAPEAPGKFAILPKELKLEIASAALTGMNPDGTAFALQFTPAASGSTQPALATLGAARSTFTLYRRCESATPPSTCGTPLNPERADDIPSTGLPDRFVRIRVRSGTKELKSASSLRNGALVTAVMCTGAAPDPCASPDRACEPHPDQFTMTAGGGWPAGFDLSQYVLLKPGVQPSDIRGVAFCVHQKDLQPEDFEIDEVAIEQVADPVLAWTADYSRFQQTLFDAGTGILALGTDFNGLYPQFHFSNHAVGYENGGDCGGDPALATFGDPTTGGTITLTRPLKIGAKELCFDARGLATYGMLPELFSTVNHYDKDVYRALFQSAWATIRTWRKAREAAASCPVADP